MSRRTLRALASQLFFLPRPVEQVQPRQLPGGSDSPAPVGRPIRILSWNIQFCAGRRGWFFYDGGPDVHVTPAEVEDALSGIGAVIRAEQPDIVLLQEVDRDSTRTGNVDQHARFATELANDGLVWSASTPYFRVPWVPVPPSRPLGAVDMHLSVFSRFPLAPGTRTALAPLQEPVYRRLFNLRRALMTLQVPTAKGPPLTLFHTHLSAFSRGDGTLGRQVGTVHDAVVDAPGPAVLVGDFNSLPPYDDPKRLGQAAVLYAESSTPIQPLWDTLDVAFPPSRGPESHTYVPWGSHRADRTIDYAFSSGVEVTGSHVSTAGSAVSDHLPVVVDLVIPSM